MQGPIGAIFSKRGSVLRTTMVLHARKGQGGSMGRVGVAPHDNRKKYPGGCECFVPLANLALLFDEVHKK